MSVFPKKILWTRIPTTPKINNYKVLGILANGSFINYANPATSVTQNGYIVTTQTKYGKAYKNPGTNGASGLGTGIKHNGERTYIFVCSRDADTATTSMPTKVQVVAHTRASGESNYFEFNLGNGFGAAADKNKPRVGAAGTAGVLHSIYIDGLKQSSGNPCDTELINGKFYTIGFTISGATENDNIELMGGLYSDTYALDGKVALAVVIDGLMSDTELEKYTKNVFSLFQPQTRYIPLSPAEDQQAATLFPKKIPWSRKPSTTVEPNLSKNLHLLLAVNESGNFVTDLITGNKIDFDGTVPLEWHQSSLGRSVRSLNGGFAEGLSKTPGLSIDETAKSTFACCIQLNSAGAAWNDYFTIGNSSLVQKISFLRANTGEKVRFACTYNKSPSIDTINTVSTGEPLILVGTVSHPNATTVDLEFFLNGVSQGTYQNISTPSWSYAFDTIRIGSIAAESNDFGFYWGAAWERNLSPNEIREISKNKDSIWGHVLQPQTRYRPIGAAGGGGFTGFQNISWKAFNELTHNTAYKIFNEFSKDTAWKLFAENSQDSSFKIFSGPSQNVSWQILGTNQKFVEIEYKFALPARPEHPVLNKNLPYYKDIVEAWALFQRNGRSLVDLSGKDTTPLRMLNSLDISYFKSDGMHPDPIGSGYVDVYYDYTAVDNLAHDSFSIIARFKGDGYIVSKHYNTTDRYGWYFFCGSGQLLANAASAVDGWEPARSQSPLGYIDTSKFVTVVMAYSNTTKKIRIFDKKGEVPYSTHQASTADPVSNDHNQQLRVGASGWSNIFDGVISDLVIVKKELTESEAAIVIDDINILYEKPIQYAPVTIQGSNQQLGSRQLSWMAFAGASRDTEYMIRGGSQTNTAWKIFDTLSQDTAYKIKNGSEEDLSWKISNTNTVKWFQDSEIIGPGLAESYGTDISVSGNGLVMAVPSQGNSSQAKVYIYDKSGDDWVYRGLVLVGSVITFDHVSVSLSYDGSVLAIGSTNYTDTFTYQGGVFIMKWNGSTWSQRGGVVVAPDAAINNYFGSSVALSEDETVLIVGAWGRADGGSTRAGGLYTFDKSGDNYIQRGLAFSANGQSEQYFGWQCSITQDKSTIVAADRNGLRTYDVSGITWVQRGSLLSDGVSSNFGYGSQISSDGNWLAAGAHLYSGEFSNQGIMCLYQRNLDNWDLTSKFVEPIPSFAYYFGRGVAIVNENELVVGCPRHPSSGERNWSHSDGAIHTFKKQPLDTAWKTYALSVQDIAFKIKQGSSVDSSWKVWNINAQDIEWRIAVLGQAQDIAWKIFVTTEQNTEWKIKQGDSQDTSWIMFNKSVQDLAWKIFKDQNQDASWKVFSGLSLDSAWKIVNEYGSDVAWKVLTQDLLSSGWKILNQDGQDISWVLGELQLFPKYTSNAQSRVLVVDAEKRVIIVEAAKRRSIH